MYVLLHFLTVILSLSMIFNPLSKSDKSELTVHFRNEIDEKFFLQYFPHAQPNAIYHSNVYNHMQNNVKKSFIWFRITTCM